jgi:hypothetical protein
MESQLDTKRRYLVADADGQLYPDFDRLEREEHRLAAIYEAQLMEHSEALKYAELLAENHPNWVFTVFKITPITMVRTTKVTEHKAPSAEWRHS